MGIVFQLPIPSCQWIQNRLWSRIRWWVQHPQWERSVTRMTKPLCWQFCIDLAPSLLTNHRLQNIANKDLVSQAIEIDLLTAAEKGQDQLNTFVEERLLPIEERRVTFRDKLPQTKYLTFASLFELQLSDTTGKAKTVKADRNILQRLIAAYEAGRPVNLNSIMMQELFVVPLSFAEVNGELRTEPKAILADILMSLVQTTWMPQIFRTNPCSSLMARLWYLPSENHKQQRLLGN